MDWKFYDLLYRWYSEQGRVFPWRLTDDPYKIWISEVVLQQTRVGQGITYYERLIRRFPSIAELAVSSERDVLHIWQGLGYYTRARNLYRAGQVLHYRYNDVFPCSYSELIQLPGVGSYTASAIMSFAFDKPFFAVDANAIRVISRLYNLFYLWGSVDGRGIFLERVNELLDRVRPREFNSSFMELGEVVCIPIHPRCDSCPVVEFCEAYRNGTVSMLPVRKEKRLLRERFFLYSVYIDSKNRTLLYQREGNDIWRHLYEFPVEEVGESVMLGDCIHLRHSLSHQSIHAYFVIKRVVELPVCEGCVVIDIRDISRYPVSSLILRAVPKILGDLNLLGDR